MKSKINRFKHLVYMIINILVYFFEDLFIYFKEITGVRYSSKPFISGDTFRSVARTIFEFDKTIDSTAIKTINEEALTSVVFIETHLMDFFLENIKSDNNKYIAILHNSDDQITHESKILNVDKVVHIFAQNQNFFHQKVTPIPIGLENLHLRKSGMVRNLSYAINVYVVRQPLIYYQFNIKTNYTERFKAKKYIEGHPFSRTTKRLRSLKYFLELKSYMFCLAPEGNGIDTHRMWECIYLGVIPICKRNYHNSFFQSLGLPIWVVEDWNDLDLYNSKRMLSEKYREIMFKSNVEASYWDYWLKLIKLKSAELL